MSIQFGTLSFTGQEESRERLDAVRKEMLRYASDRESELRDGTVTILYHPFHTTRESRWACQPFVSRAGTVVTWDGRLDNREDFSELSGEEPSSPSSDASIVAAAYERWGVKAFAKLIGDWAVSIWSPKENAVLLAKDHIGTRQLYYSISQRVVRWSTLLDPLVTLADAKLSLDEEYIAGWLSFFPDTRLTPFVEIHSVPASCYVRIENGLPLVGKYWDFDPVKEIRFRRDSEYEEHFRDLFARAVTRRLRSDAPVIAELSGGMDSSSIVCMADDVVARGAATATVHTVSYYDDAEPNGDDLCYATRIENQRGRPGCHISAGSCDLFKVRSRNSKFAATPSSIAESSTEGRRQFAALVGSRGIRVVLSGMGGDEVTGGVPTFVPELEDLISRARFRQLAGQLKLWALSKRKPWVHIFLESARGFFPLTFAGVPKHLRPPVWLRADFVARNKAALSGYLRRVKLFSPLPSFQENLSTIETLRRQMGCLSLSAEVRCEKRYPYLDRDLLEFLCAVPREQIVRPGQRRSLMRRSLAGIVPDEILNRKRKAFVSRSPLVSISAERSALLQMTREMVAASLEIVDSAAFREVVEQAIQGRPVPTVSLMRTLVLEAWLRCLVNNGVLGEPTGTASQGRGAGVSRAQTAPETTLAS